MLRWQFVISSLKPITNQVKCQRRHDDHRSDSERSRLQQSSNQRRLFNRQQQTPLALFGRPWLTRKSFRREGTVAADTATV